MKYRNYTRKHKVTAYNIFHQRDFKATEILSNEDFLIFDWKESGGSGNLATRYILDKKKGNLIIAGDSGDCIASWYDEVTPKDMESFVNDIGYFISKMQCTSDKCTYRHDDIAEDIEKLKEEYEGELLPDFDRLIELLDEADVTENGLVFNDEAIEIIENWCGRPWWETGIEKLGKRISSRVYLWSVGYQMGYAQLTAGKEK